MFENFSAFFITSNSSLIDCALLILRLFIGFCFVVHGLGKLGLVGTGNMAGFADWLKSMNFPFAHLQARIAMASEIAGGVFIAFGLFHRVGCLLVFVTMLVATFIGHRGTGYLITNTPPGGEYTLNLAAISFALFLTGPGRYSMDMIMFAGM